MTSNSIESIQSKLSFFDDKTLRTGQRQAIEFAMKSTKRFVAIEMPTGGGKSAVGVISGMLTGKSINLVHSKALQDQNESDFPEVPVLKGRSNYTCGRDAALKANECKPSKDKPCTPMICDYSKQKQKCLHAPMKSLNYPYLLTECNFAGGQFAGHDLVICDEADTIDNTLEGFISLKITNKKLDRYKLPQPPYKAVDAEHKLEKVKNWGFECLSIVGEVYESASRACETCAKSNGGWIADELIKDMEECGSALAEFRMFVENVNGKWLHENVRNRFNDNIGHVWKPTWLTPDLTQKYLYRHGKKWILMSATLPPPNELCQRLGIPRSELDMIKLPSEFKPENSPIYFTRSWNGNGKVFDIDNAVDAVSKILAHHPDQKGIIHTVNYKIADILVDRCQVLLDNFNNRLVTHRSHDRGDVLRGYLNTSDPRVLVSPSMDRGISLDGDKCRFSIIAKTPFLFLGNEQVKARRFDKQVDGRAWYASMAVESMIQMVGRPVRSWDDWAVHYFIDISSAEVFNGNGGMFSRYFKQCIRHEELKWLK
jgi:Rad3-related DNA helicase